MAETRAPNAQVAVGRRRASRVPIKPRTAPCTKSTSLSGIIALPHATPDERLVAIMLHVALGGNWVWREPPLRLRIASTVSR